MDSSKVSVYSLFLSSSTFGFFLPFESDLSLLHFPHSKRFITPRFLFFELGVCLDKLFFSCFLIDDVGVRSKRFAFGVGRLFVIRSSGRGEELRKNR